MPDFLVMVISNKNSEFKPVKLHLKIDPVSYPARAKGLVNMIRTETVQLKGIHFPRVVELCPFSLTSPAPETERKK